MNIANRSSREKLFIGAQLRQIRTGENLTQADFAARLGLSPSYMNQLEHDQRPVSAAVLMRLSQSFNIDISALSNNETDRLAADLKSALAEPNYEEIGLELGLIRHLTNAAPELARAFLKSHALNQKYEARLQAMDAQFDSGHAASPNAPTATALPYDEVRDYFHNSDNYIDVLDRAAENLSVDHALFGVGNLDRLCAYLQEHHDFTVTSSETSLGATQIYRLDTDKKTITLNNAQSPSTRAFQLAGIIGLLEQREALGQLLDQANFQSHVTRDICQRALINYYAGALLMPYGHFLNTIRETRHDIERAQHLYGTSFEQVSHRLSNMQRPGMAGIPFYFVRVDRAGNITKRHSATKLQFARFGGVCPLWNVHEAFTVPGRIFIQVAQTPDGTKYLSIARSIVKRAGRFDGFNRHYSIGLGCEIKHADQLVYAAGLDMSAPSAITPIGVSCRICERHDCPQRAFPPVGRAITASANTRDIVPYSIDE